MDRCQCQQQLPLQQPHSVGSTTVSRRQRLSGLRFRLAAMRTSIIIIIHMAQLETANTTFCIPRFEPLTYRTSFIRLVCGPELLRDDAMPRPTRRAHALISKGFVRGIGKGCSACCCCCCDYYSKHPRGDDDDLLPASLPHPLEEQVGLSQHSPGAAMTTAPLIPLE
jgi:hypothetical protein